jgi:DNA-binding protein HU-beta
MRKADLVSRISEKTDIAKVDVLLTLETFFSEVKDSIADKENVYIRGFGSFVAKKRAKKIGRNIKKNTAIEIPAHYIPSFKPAKAFVSRVKDEALVEEENATK